MLQGNFKKHDWYYIGIAVYVLSINIQYSYMNNIWVMTNSPALLCLKAMRYMAYLFCVIGFLMGRKLKPTEIVFIIVFFIAGAYALLTGKQNDPIFYFLLIFTGLGADFRKIVKIFLFIQVTTLVCFSLLSLSGVLGDSFIEIMDRKRYFLGYGWVNRASYSWFFISLELLYLKRMRLSVFYAALILVVNLGIYYLTDTVFSMLMTCGVVIVGLLNYFNRKIKKEFGRFKDLDVGILCMIFFAITVVIGVVLPVLYDSSNQIMAQFNRMLNSRLSLGKTAIDKFGLHLWGTKIEWVGSSRLLFEFNNEPEYYLYVDSGFLQLALSYGLFFTGVIAFIYLYAIRIASIIKDYSAEVCFLVLGMLFIFEPYVIDFAFNPFIFYFVCMLARKKDLALKTQNNQKRENDNRKWLKRVA